MIRVSIHAVALAMVITGCTAAHKTVIELDTRGILEQAEEMEIYALHPDPHREEGRSGMDEESFHGYRVLGKTRLEQAADRKRLIELVYRGIDSSDGTRALCFNPRHGIRAVRGGRLVDLVICYECLQLDVHGPGPEAGERISTAEEVVGRVNRFFTDHGLTVHERPGR